MIKQFLKHKCNSKIKLFIAVICMFALVMSVSGCGNGNSGSDNTNATQSTVATYKVNRGEFNWSGNEYTSVLQIRKSGMSANIWLITVENAVRLLLIILIWKAQSSMLNHWKKQVFLP